MSKAQAPKAKPSKAEKDKMPPRSLTRTMPRNLIPALWALVFHGQDIHNAVLYLLRQIAFAYDKEKTAEGAAAEKSETVAEPKKSVYSRKSDDQMKPELLRAFTIARDAFNAQIPLANAARRADWEKAA